MSREMLTLCAGVRKFWKYQRSIQES